MPEAAAMTVLSWTVSAPSKAGVLLQYSNHDGAVDQRGRETISRKDLQIPRVSVTIDNIYALRVYIIYGVTYSAAEVGGAGT